MLERAEEIRRQKVTDGKSKYGASSNINFSSGFGNSGNNSSTYNSSHSVEPSVFEASSPPPSFNNSSSSSNKPSRAMKLGTNKDILPAFIEQEAKQAAPVGKNQTGVSQSSTVSNTER